MNAHRTIYDALFEFQVFEYLLKSIQIALSKYQGGYRAQKRDQFLVSKVEFYFFYFPAKETLHLLLNSSQIELFLAKYCPS